MPVKRLITSKVSSSPHPGNALLGCCAERKPVCLFLSSSSTDYVTDKNCVYEKWVDFYHITPVMLSSFKLLKM